MFRQSIRLFSTAKVERKTITETAKDALKTVNDVASKAALKGVEGTEAVANAAKSTVSGSSKTAEGIVDKAKVQVKQNSSDSTTQLGGAADSIKGSAKKLQGQAQSKAEEVKQKL